MKYNRIEDGYILRLEKGEEVVSSLMQFALVEKIPSATICGIGALKDVTVGYFDTKAKEYPKQEFNGEFELLSLLGNLSYLDDKPILHAHVILSRTDFTLFGGHLFSATVAVTVEARVKTFASRLTRVLDPDIGLNLWQL